MIAPFEIFKNDYEKLLNDYEELQLDHRITVRELGYMRLRYGTPTWNDIKNGVGLPPEVKKLIKNEEA
jgi:hypothetical protein